MQIIPKEVAAKAAADLSKSGQVNTDVTTAVEEVVEEQITPPTEEKLSPKYAQLARREAAVRAKELEIKAAEEKLKAKDEEYRTKYIPKDEVGKRLTSNFQEASSEFGLSYDQLTQSLLNQPSAETQAYEDLKRQIEQMKSAQEQEKQQATEREQANYNRAIESIRQQAMELVETDPEFETIKSLEQAEQIVEHIVETNKTTGKVLTVAEAAKVIEERLIEEAIRVAKLQKVQARLAPKPEEPAKVDPKSQSLASAKTLTNSVGVNRPLTAKERALLAFKGELK